jgi:hypothetical protein
MADGLEEAERPFVMTQGVGVAALEPGQVGKTLPGPGLPHAITDPLIQPEGAFQVSAGLNIITGDGAGASQPPVGHGLPERIAKACRCCQGGAHNGG